MCVFSIPSALCYCGFSTPPWRVPTSPFPLLSLLQALSSLYPPLPSLYTLQHIFRKLQVLSDAGISKGGILISGFQEHIKAR